MMRFFLLIVILACFPVQGFSFTLLVTGDTFNVIQPCPT